MTLSNCVYKMHVSLLFFYNNFARIAKLRTYKVPYNLSFKLHFARQQAIQQFYFYLQLIQAHNSPRQGLLQAKENLWSTATLIRLKHHSDLYCLFAYSALEVIIKILLVQHVLSCLTWLTTWIWWQFTAKWEKSLQSQAMSIRFHRLVSFIQ